jgi:hypothetical protein
VEVKGRELVLMHAASPGSTCNKLLADNSVPVKAVIGDGIVKSVPEGTYEIRLKSVLDDSELLFTMIRFVRAANVL